MGLELPRARPGVGVFFVVYALINAILIIPGAKHARSPALYVCLFAAIFSIIPALLGIAIIVNHRRMRRTSR
jgi:hypothetical protein